MRLGWEKFLDIIVFIHVYLKIGFYKNKKYGDHP